MQKTLFDGESAIETDITRDSHTLLVTFGGIAQGIGIPRFEFHRITHKLPAKLTFVRDLSQSWYHSELPDIGTGICALSKTIQTLKAQTGATRLVCIGNSMGGYAALLIGHLAAADEVIAFSPQTFINWWLRTRYRDNRWRPQIKTLYRNQAALKETFNLRSFLQVPGYQKATIFADREHRLDAIHALRMETLPKTSVIWGQGGHNLVKQLRDSGKLEQILISACAF